MLPMVRINVKTLKDLNVRTITFQGWVIALELAPANKAYIF